MNPDGLPPKVRHLVIVLGDQLDQASSALEGFDAAQDVVWMAEVAEESTHVWSSKQRIALFLSAMRHFAQWLSSRAYAVSYTALDDPDNLGKLDLELARAIDRLRPQTLVMAAPGDWRVLQLIKTAASAKQLTLALRDDKHFFSTVREFSAHAGKRKQLRLEYWYRELRQKHGILMQGGQPEGGQWNFDADNRKSFGKAGPGLLPPPSRFAPDAITLEVMALVKTTFPGHPGSLDTFGWAVTREDA